MTENQLREEIVRVGLSLFERGYVHATAGNISVRLPDGGFLITPTDACLGFEQTEALLHDLADVCRGARALSRRSRPSYSDAEAVE